MASNLETEGVWLLNQRQLGRLTLISVLKLN